MCMVLERLKFLVVAYFSFFTQHPGQAGEWAAGGPCRAYDSPGLWGFATGPASWVLGLHWLL